MTERFIRLMTERELALKLNVKHTTLQQWRHNGKGPPYIKMGRTVRYDAYEVQNWLERVNPTPKEQDVKANQFGGPEMPRMNMKRTRFNFDNVD